MSKQKIFRSFSPSDEVFLQDFYEQNKKFIYFAARKYAQSEEECAEIVQETVVRLLDNIPMLRTIQGSAIYKYLTLTVRAACLDVRRRRSNDEQSFLDKLLQEEYDASAHVPSDAEENAALLRRLDGIKKNLAPRDWAVLEAKYILGYSDEEIAKLLGMTPDSVQMALCRARASVRKMREE